jgi:hypothetical protein
MKRLQINKGDKYNRLTIIKEVEKNGDKRCFLCECACGKIKKINLNLIRRGNTKSCGCLGIENRKKTLIKHGKTGKRIYRIWSLMKQRCLNTNFPKYKDYGKRGIKVCKDWLKFENFDKDMNTSYVEHLKKYGEENTTIDRIDNDGNYVLKNCQWATKKVQGRNQRTNNIIEYKGEKHCVIEWAELTGINEGKLRRRIALGWATNRLFTI